MPKRKRGEPPLNPEEIVSILDEFFTRSDPDEFERRFAESLRRPRPRPEDMFPKEKDGK